MGRPYSGGTSTAPAGFWPKTMSIWSSPRAWTGSPPTGHGHTMAGREVRAQDDFVAGAVRMQQHQAQGVPAVEVPNLVVWWPLDQGLNGSRE
jgi:hypothetical protein